MSQAYEASMAIQILPNIAETEKSVAVIDEVIAYIKTKNLSMVVCPFETVIEGTLDEMMEILKHSILLAEEAGQADVLTNIKIAYSKGKQGVLSIDEKTTKHNL